MPGMSQEKMEARPENPVKAIGAYRIEMSGEVKKLSDSCFGGRVD